MSIDKAYNYKAANERVATSGRVEPEQLAELSAAGFEAVINLLPDSIELSQM